MTKSSQDIIDGIENVRRKVALYTAIILTIVLVASILLGNIMSNIDNDIKNIKNFEKESLDNYEKLIISMEKSFSKYLISEWEHYKINNIEFERFVSNYIDHNAPLSIVVLVDEENNIIHAHYTDDRYSDIKEDIVKNRENHSFIINDDSNKIFGAGERFYGASGMLDNNTFIIIGSTEEIRYENFIGTLDSDILKGVRCNIQKAIHITNILTISIILFGTLVIYICRILIIKQISRMLRGEDCE